MLAGTKSGAGKTTITCGILQLLINQGYKVSSFKCGPDYIDPMFHGKVIGTRSGNLDSFFTGEKELCELLYNNSKDTEISALEGVMGYYDGMGFSDTASTYSVAAMTKTPVILIIDAKGISGSLGAIIKGFLTYKKESYIKGVIYNRLPERLYVKARELAEDLGVKAYGYVPDIPECSLKSRHLGLVTAEEIKDLKEKLNRLADKLSETIDLQGILALAEEAPPLKVSESDLSDRYKGDTADRNEITLAVAQDEAFCFTYRDNLELLKKLGAALIPFSPIKDNALPEGADGLLLCGGYPELYAKELSENDSMRNSIKRAVQSGMPTIAECGGFMYLHENLEDMNGVSYPMAGVIKGRCFKTERLQRFGYIQLKGNEDSLIAGKQETIKAHEFHYWDSDNCGKDFHAEKPNDTREWECVHAGETFYAGFPHLYFYGNPSIAERFLDKCSQYGTCRKAEG
jgi:cobyrinic acid a,c-diamide synthase